MKKVIIITAFWLTWAFTVLNAAGGDQKILSESEIDGFVKTSSMETISDSFAIDLNEDALQDKLVGVTCGNGGCEYYCFLLQPDKRYKFAGTISLHKLGFEILRSKHNGINDILSYWRGNVATGGLTRYEYDCKTFKVK